MDKVLELIIKEIEETITEISVEVGDSIEYIRVVDTKQIRENLLETEIDYKFISGRWGWVDILEDTYNESLNIRISSSNKFDGDIENDIIIYYEEGWVGRFKEILVDYHF